jgi:hypothetical protein
MIEHSAVQSAIGHNENRGYRKGGHLYRYMYQPESGSTAAWLFDADIITKSHIVIGYHDLVPKIRPVIGLVSHAIGSVLAGRADVDDTEHDVGRTAS